MITFKLLRNENVLLFFRSKNDREFLNQHFEWMQYFDSKIRVQMKFFKIFMHAIQIKNVNFNNNVEKINATKIFVIVNANQISTLTVENINYMNWLKKFFFEKIDKTIAIIEFRFSTTTNEIIRKNFIWNDKIHACEKLIKNCRIKQCFNCFVYDYIKIQCRSIQKCDKCDENDHEANTYQIFKFKIKCVVCDNFHKIDAKIYHRHRTKTKKIKTMKIVVFFFSYLLLNLHLHWFHKSIIFSKSIVFSSFSAV